jgi:hypothetical protein
VPLRGTDKSADGSVNSGRSAAGKTNASRADRAERDAAHEARLAARRGAVVGTTALKIDEYDDVLERERLLAEDEVATELATGASLAEEAVEAHDAERAKSRAGAGRARLRVAPPLPVAVPRAPFLVLLLVIVVAGVFGVLLINTKINENAFTLDNMHNTQSSLDQQEQQLTQDLTKVEAPGNLAALARRLGLVPAGSTAVIRLPDGQVISVPEPASGPVSVTAQH